MTSFLLFSAYKKEEGVKTLEFFACVGDPYVHIVKNQRFTKVSTMEICCILMDRPNLEDLPTKNKELSICISFFRKMF